MGGRHYATDQPKFVFHHKKRSQGDISIFREGKKIETQVIHLT